MDDFLNPQAEGPGSKLRTFFTDPKSWMGCPQCGTPLLQSHHDALSCSNCSWTGNVFTSPPPSPAWRFLMARLIYQGDHYHQGIVAASSQEVSPEALQGSLERMALQAHLNMGHDCFILGDRADFAADRASDKDGPSPDDAHYHLMGPDIDPAHPSSTVHLDGSSHEAMLASLQAHLPGTQLKSHLYWMGPLYEGDDIVGRFFQVENYNMPPLLLTWHRGDSHSWEPHNIILSGLLRHKDLDLDWQGPSLIWQPFDWRVLTMHPGRIHPRYAACVEIHEDLNACFAVSECQDTGQVYAKASFRTPLQSWDHNIKTLEDVPIKEAVERFRKKFNEIRHKGQDSADYGDLLIATEFEWDVLTDPYAALAALRSDASIWAPEPKATS